MENQQIPLNIIMTYPVHWGRYKVLRDFIQNFFDSVSIHDWKERFHYSYNDGKLSMWVENVVFSYEWLLHIGASTKREDANHRHAGYFGEGFKIASLCAFRDFKWDVCMSSGDWSLKVIKLQKEIDATKVDMLAYDVMQKSKEDESRLELYHVTPEEYNTFLTVLNSFFYDGNPLVGDKVWEGNDAAVYLCDTSQYDYNLPYTYEFGRNGAIFCAYQLLGSNPFGLCICKHDYKQKDRERSTLYEFEAVRVFGEVCCRISPEGAVIVLERMRRYWNSVPKREIDIRSWGPVIRSLIIRISYSDSATRLFRENHPNLLYLCPVHSIYERNRRKEAYAWAKQQAKPYHIVQVSFEILGYSSLEEECEKNGGFVQNSNPNSVENQCMSIIEEAAVKVYGTFFGIDSENLPERKIISNFGASYHGMAVLKKSNKKIKNEYGLKIKNIVRQIYLKRIIFRKDGFCDALSTYIHECCHAFGGDASQSFSRALTHAIEILMENYEVIQEYNAKWEELFS